MLRYSRKQKSRSDEENPYWISFSDLMSALLVVFILAVVALVLQLNQKQSSLDEQQAHFSRQIGTLQNAESVRKAMVVDIQKTLKAKGLEVIVSEDSSVISIPSERLGFQASSYSIEDSHREVARAIGTVMSDALRDENRTKYFDTVFVEGHTDNRNFDGLEGTGNWGLSTFRAISLWNLWEEDLPKESQLGQLENANGSPLFSVSGYGETRPITSKQTTEAERSTNRRIDLRFTIVRPTAQDLLDLENKAKQVEVP